MTAASFSEEPMNSEHRRIARALISVSDKRGLIPFAQALADRGVELVSTGGTHRALREAGVSVLEVADLTGFPEMMDGRIKTLHPNVHGGLLAIRENPEHEAAMLAHNIKPIDLLVVNLYPFEATVAKGGSYDESIENIDIGGPAMIRGAAKNHGDVAVVVDPDDYDALLQELAADGGTTLATRKRLAQKAFARTAVYDAAISNWMAEVIGENAPTYRAFGGKLIEALRYGENPHQQAAFYATSTTEPGIATARQMQGKSLSYNNVNDTDAAIGLVAEFPAARGPAVAIIKHANPCGVATGATFLDAYAAALRCDSVSAFGGIVALNGRLDAATAAEIAKIFTEVIVAPEADDEAIALLAAKKNLRLLLTGGMPDPRGHGLTFRPVGGGFLVQGRDNAVVDDLMLNVVTKRQPSERELVDLRFAFSVAKHVKSNAIVYAKDGATVGIGAGQMSRLDSSRMAALKALDAARAVGLDTSLAQGSVVASDAFFPFADGLLAAAEAGVTAVIQPGGSMRDADIIAAADQAGLAMVLTGTRHFRH
jgi:phosphoribosylaminoimidazolecarboxamide formyltransferase/IMP cyclohydrolase